MEKIYVIYYSQTGNTKEMAEAIGEGIEAGGKTAEVVPVEEIAAEQISTAPVFALGCPAMGAEQLSEEMEPFVEQVETFASGKQIALFGSYGWGSGEWMRDWEQRMQNAGAQLIGGEGIICNEVPDEETLEKCRELGKKMVEQVRIM